jgi:hypothetical protein
MGGSSFRVELLMTAGDGDDSGKRGLLRLKVSNTLLKSSSSPPSPKSDSINFGGVAVLAELAVIARSLTLPEGRSSKEGVEGLIGFLFPKEKVRPTARREKVEWGGGMGISWRSGASVEEGRVDDELKRAEEELSYGFPEKAELSVPPLPLFFGSDFSIPEKMLSMSSVGELDERA